MVVFIDFIMELKVEIEAGSDQSRKLPTNGIDLPEGTGLDEMVIAAIEGLCPNFHCLQAIVVQQASALLTSSKRTTSPGTSGVLWQCFDRLPCLFSDRSVHLLAKLAGWPGELQALARHRILREPQPSDIPYLCPPPEAGLPGFGYHAGEHFNDNSTWWDQAGPMLEDMSRACDLRQRELKPFANAHRIPAACDCACSSIP